jgi:putative membrane protein
MFFWPWFIRDFDFRWLVLILPLMLIGVIVWAVVKLSGTSESRQSEYRRQQKKNEALEILKTRLASGDITEEEYDRLKSRIQE